MCISFCKAKKVKMYIGHLTDVLLNNSAIEPSSIVLAKMNFSLFLSAWHETL